MLQHLFPNVCAPNVAQMYQNWFDFVNGLSLNLKVSCLSIPVDFMAQYSFPEKLMPLCVYLFGQFQENSAAIP